MKLIGPAVALALLILTVPASAQQELLPPPPDAENNVSRLRLGPFWLNPSIALTNAGIDTNVFNEPDSHNPKSDFTFTITPPADGIYTLHSAVVTGCGGDVVQQTTSTNFITIGTTSGAGSQSGSGAGMIYYILGGLLVVVGIVVMVVKRKRSLA